jgi:hypothetical protein
MARGSLPDQVPKVPPELFFAFNDLYLYIKRLSSDLGVIEGPGGPGGGFGGHQIQDEGVGVPQRGVLNFTGSGVQVVDTGTKTAVVITGGHSYFPSGW